MDSLPSNIILILASKTQLSHLQPHTLIQLQGNKSTNLWFVKYGRVKIIRNIEVIEEKGREWTVHDYHEQFKEPTDAQRKAGFVKHIQLEVTELGNAECFGEDYDSISNALLSPEELSKKPLPYTVISSQPLEVYCIKKTALYYYLDDQAKK